MTCSSQSTRVVAEGALTSPLRRAVTSPAESADPLHEKRRPPPSSRHVVDEDVDPFNLPRVMWALSTKLNPAGDLITILNLPVLERAPRPRPRASSTSSALRPERARGAVRPTAARPRLTMP
ncbi:hypothetical protein [Streptomyces sp. NPDC003247]|uniref:hypothetical protein n=1 Tax=Streptomyces sp. NPDC003247 TaxID=3364677 RepID=UPI0036BB696E